MTYQICWHCGHEIAPGLGEVYEIEALLSDEPVRRWCHHRCRRGIQKEVTVSEPKFKLVPRNDMVVVRLRKVDKVRGVVMPDTSSEGRRYEVVAAGPKVEGLKPGDIVLHCGKLGVNASPIPNYPEHVIMAQEVIVLVLQPVPEMSAYEQIADHDQVVS